MKELVEVIAKSLVDLPDKVVVTERETEKGLILERIAKAIRSVVKAAASREDKKVIIEIE